MHGAVLEELRGQAVAPAPQVGHHAGGVEGLVGVGFTGNLALSGGTARRTPRASPDRHPRDLFLGSLPVHRIRVSSTSSAARRRLLLLDHTAGRTTPVITRIAIRPGRPTSIIASCESLAKMVAVAPPATAAFETTLPHWLTAQAGRDCSCVHDHFLLPGATASGNGVPAVCCALELVSLPQSGRRQSPPTSCETASALEDSSAMPSWTPSFRKPRTDDMRSSTECAPSAPPDASTTEHSSTLSTGPPTTRLGIRCVYDSVLLVTRADHGIAEVSTNRYFRFPFRQRRRAELHIGDKVLLVAHLTPGHLAVYPLPRTPRVLRQPPTTAGGITRCPRHTIRPPIPPRSRRPESCCPRSE